jgi:predicted DNA-binding transcriptional regulator AlpA
MSYVGRTDLRDRGWIYTRQGIDYLINKDPTFPSPVFSINGGRMKVWLESDIEEYEDDHPELFDERAKKKKIASFAWGQLQKARKG